jgi:hypothetical protein
MNFHLTAACCLQEFKLLIIRQVFRYGNVPQWRKIIRSMTSNDVPGLQMTRVPASTFKVCRCCSLKHASPHAPR